MLEQSLKQILPIARGGFQSHQHLFRRHPQSLKPLKKPVESLKRIGKRGRFDDLSFVHRQAGHRTGLHADIDAHHMGRHDLLGHRGGRSRHHRCSLSSPSSSCSHRRTYRDAPQRGRPPSQDERELISDRQSSQRVPGAATSPIVASGPDGRGAVYSRRSLSVSKRAACYDDGSPVASTSIADAIFLRRLSYLPISI